MTPPLPDMVVEPAVKLVVDGVSKKFRTRDGLIEALSPVSFNVKEGEVLCLVGPSGCGNSTMLNIIAGFEKPDKGHVMPGLTTRYGYFTQESIALNPANRLIEEVKEIAEFITLSDGSQVSASKFLDIFLFPPEKQYNYIDKLSGGEKKRLQLLKLLVTNPNFLILDEPTNDFDIDTLNVLEDFLEKFSGCLLLVSHDRYFMDHLVDQLFVFEGDGKIRLFSGNYSDYRDWLEDQEAMKTAQPVKPAQIVQEKNRMQVTKKRSATRKSRNTRSFNRR